VLSVLLTLLVAAHPGHGSMALVGTLVAAGATSISIEVREVESATTRRMDIRITPDSKFRLGKQSITTLADSLGHPVVVTVDYEEDVDGRTIYTAAKVQVTLLKAKKR
jgi:hypothetical protein